jgi:hypothetical protein
MNMSETMYILRYKAGLSQVQTGFLLADSQAQAEEIGRRYCGSKVGHRYVSVSPAILATSAILGPVKVEEVEVGVKAVEDLAQQPKRKAS